MLRDDGSVQVLPWQSQDNYDRLLSENVAFLDLLDASANNAVLECLARGTRPARQSVSAVIEYLGQEIPLVLQTVWPTRRACSTSRIPART